MPGLIHYESYEEYINAREEVIKQYEAFDGIPPYSIPLGGSTPVGVIGYVNAGFELAIQVAWGEIPPPDRIYVHLETMGTAVGLLLGLKATG